MKYKKTDLCDKELSAVVLGCDYYGGAIEKADAHALLDRYFELGGNVIDTARMYAGGQSERTIGEWFKEGGRRSEAFLISKCAHPENGGRARLSPSEIEKDIDKSLSLLATDRLDLLFLHRDDTEEDVCGIIDTLDNMVKKGKILHYGASNWKSGRIEAAKAYAASAGKKAFAASEIKWSLARTSPAYAEDETLAIMDGAEREYYRRAGIPVFAYASQAKGFFAKMETGGAAALSKKARERYLCEKNLAVFERAKGLAAELSVSVNAVNLAYLSSQREPEVFPIIGAKSVLQLEDSLKYADLALTEEMLGLLEK